MTISNRRIRPTLLKSILIKNFHDKIAPYIKTKEVRERATVELKKKKNNEKDEEDERKMFVTSLTPCDEFTTLVRLYIDLSVPPKEVLVVRNNLRTAATETTTSEMLLKDSQCPNICLNSDFVKKTMGITDGFRFPSLLEVEDGLNSL